MDIVAKYNPANTNLTEDEIKAMQDLTPEQVKQLAEAYPNQPRGNAYLVYYDKSRSAKEQLYSLGTWANLHNLQKIGYNHIVAAGFKSKNFHPPTVNVAEKNQRTVDLSAEEAKKAEGIKTPPVPASEDVKSQTPVKAEAAETENTELQELEAELAQKKAEGAHHMTIKGIENKIAALKNPEGTDAEKTKK